MKSLLLIEDDRWLRQSYQRSLEHGGFKIDAVHDAETAMQAIEQAMPDVIVADVMLQGHTVFALLHELQSYDDTQRIPVVLCSNLEQDRLDTAKLSHYGVVRVLDKAVVKPEDMIIAVEEAVHL